MWRRKWLPCGALLQNQTFKTTSFVGHGYTVGNPGFFSTDRSEKSDERREMWKTTETASFVSRGFTIGNPGPSSPRDSGREMQRRKWLPCFDPLQNQKPKTMAFVGHGFAIRNPSPSESGGVNFPSFSTVGSIRHFSSDHEDDAISFAEAKRLMRLVNVEGLKAKLGAEGKEVISYYELLEACESIGVARSSDEAARFARILDEAGVVLLFRDKVYLHPDKVVDLVRRAVPLALTSEDDPIRNELRSLQKKKQEIDVLAHKQVRRVLWTGLVGAMLQVGLFFRLTFWEFSWDVMEPIAFFTTASGLVIGYAYFLITSRDPTYQDLMKRLFLNRQRKLFRKYDFDCERFKELQRKCKHHLDAASSIRNQVGMDLELDDALQRD